jgi:WD40 repeat protein/serine/threonine protein kinase
MSDLGGEKEADLGRDDEVLADWVAELVERLEGGDRVDLDALAEAHPDEAEELRRILPTIRRMASFGRAVTCDPGPVEATSRPGPEPGLGTLGDFRLLREVGRGGMGLVYEAEQISLQRRVALKILPLAAALDPRNHQRFLLESRAAACLHHAHIVPVYAVGSERGVPFYAMQFIDGCTLAQVLEQLRDRDAAGRRGTLTPPAVDPPKAPASTRLRSQAGVSSLGSGTGTSSSLGTSNRDRRFILAVAEHGRRAAEALDHAHSRGILHRDVKPANLMLDVEGNLWVTDFGLAQIQGDSRLTLTGDVLGTLRYMSPEQALAKRVVIDGRTDVYSLGATLYELLTLRPVFDGVDRTEILRKIAQEEPTPLRGLNSAVPQDLETIIHKTLAKEPSDRYATARELADDLGRFLDARPIAARPPGRLERLGKWARRNGAVVAPTLLFTLLTLIAVAGGLIWSNRWLLSHNERLRIERDRAGDFARELKDQRDLAEQRRGIGDRHLYAFRLRQAGEAFRARQLEKAQEILRDCRPGPGEDDLREFAWRHLWRESRREVALLSEWDEQVWSLALSPDGRTVATGDRDGTIRFRDASTHEVRLVLRGHQLPVGALAFSSDGRRLASGSFFKLGETVLGRGELLVWETGSGRLLASLGGFEQRLVWGLRFDPTGEHLWVLSRPPGGLSEVGLWKLEASPDALRPRLVGRWASCDTLPVSADGRRVAGYEDEGRVVVVEEPSSGRVLCRLPRRPNKYQCAALSPDGRLVATAESIDVGQTRAKLAIWETESGRLIADDLEGPWPSICKLEFDADARSLVAMSTAGVLYHYDIGTRERWAIEVDHSGDGNPRSSLCFLPGGRELSWSHWGQASRPLRIYDRASGAVRATFPGRLDATYHEVGFPDGRSLAFCCGTRALIWHFAPSVEPQPAGHTDESWAVGFADDGRVLATGSDDTDDHRTLKLWDTATGALLRGWKAHNATTGAVAFQPGGRVIASAGLLREENLRLWDAATGNLLATLDGHTDKVRSVSFTPDGRVLASGGSDLTIRLWDVAARRCIRTLSGHSDTIRQVVFSPDGRTLASVSVDFTVRLWGRDGEAPLWTWKGGVKVAAAAFSPDGRVLAWVHEDGVIQRWDLVEGRLLGPIHGEYDELRCLAFSPDGRTLAAAGKSGSIHLWDPVSGQELLSLEGPSCQVNALAFSPDGSGLAACWHDGTVRIFRSVY